MARFLIDENLPSSLAPMLRAAGLHAEDLRDSGRRGWADDDIFEYARASGLVLLTSDIGFGSLIRFPLGEHPGIVVVRFPNAIPATTVNQAVLQAIRQVPDIDNRR